MSDNIVQMLMSMPCNCDEGYCSRCSVIDLDPRRRSRIASLWASCAADREIGEGILSAPDVCRHPEGKVSLQFGSYSRWVLATFHPDDDRVSIQALRPDHAGGFDDSLICRDVTDSPALKLARKDKTWLAVVREEILAVMIAECRSCGRSGDATMTPEQWAKDRCTSCGRHPDHPKEES